jgi:hypothetical protein
MPVTRLLEGFALLSSEVCFLMSAHWYHDYQRISSEAHGFHRNNSLGTKPWILSNTYSRHRLEITPDNLFWIWTCWIYFISSFKYGVLERGVHLVGIPIEVHVHMPKVVPTRRQVQVLVQKQLKLQQNRWNIGSDIRYTHRAAWVKDAIL